MFRRQGLRHRRALRLRRCPCRRAPPSGGRSGTILYTKPMPNDTTQPQKPAKKSRRPSLVTIALVLLMLAGLGVLLYPTISDQFARWQAVQEIAQYNQVAEAEQADYSDLWAAAEAYNRRLAETGTFTGSVLNEDAADLQDVSQYLNPLGTGMMGYIDIPKINVHLPIYQGTGEKALQSGAGFWIGTSLPTGGPSTHCVITAHNGLVKAKMFTDLDQLEEGDTFTLSVLDRVMTYEMDQILVTLPDEMEPLQIVPGEDLVTLYTCTPYGVNTHRLLVRGHRIETPATAESAAGEGTASGLSLTERVILLALLLVALILLIYGIVGIIRRARQLKQRQHKAGNQNNPTREESTKHHEEHKQEKS